MIMFTKRIERATFSLENRTRNEETMKVVLQMNCFVSILVDVLSVSQVRGSYDKKDALIIGIMITTLEC